MRTDSGSRTGCGNRSVSYTHLDVYKRQQYTLPQLTEALHLDLRVDIFTNEDVSEGTTAGDIATYVYKDSGYGLSLIHILVLCE